MNVLVGVISPAPAWVMPRRFVDQLRVDVLVGTEHREAGAHRAAAHLLAHTGVPANAGLPLLLGAVRHN
jgi:hypothetical protein